MIKVGLIGYGKWGKILHKNIMSICNVKLYVEVLMIINQS